MFLVKDAAKVSRIPGDLSQSLVLLLMVRRLSGFFSTPPYPPLPINQNFGWNLNRAGGGRTNRKGAADQQSGHRTEEEER